MRREGHAGTGCQVGIFGNDVRDHCVALLPLAARGDSVGARQRGVHKGTVALEQIMETVKHAGFVATPQ